MGLLDFFGRKQRVQEFGRAQAAQDVFLLPIAVIYETGNHIAQSPNGAKRRVVAEGFVELVRKAFEGESPLLPPRSRTPKT